MYSNLNKIYIAVSVLLLISCGRHLPVSESGEYRNVFTELGIPEDEVQRRIDDVVQQFFYGGANQRLYYEFGDDMAYILDVNNNDIRSEGMSYGMMFCVQLDMQEEFDKLWKFSDEKMRYKSGGMEGYFAWQLNTAGEVIGDIPACDGEEYYIMALLFADQRWGSREGLFNYKEQADTILDHMVRHREILSLPDSSWSPTSMIHPEAKQVVFVPHGGSAEHTDPSYHLPHFYELWALWASDHNALWLEVAEQSRILFRNACHPDTGLAPDYSEFDGTPVEKGSHYRFEYDAWRVAGNISLDYYWWGRDKWQKKSWVKSYQSFFAQQGLADYPSLYDIDGSNADGIHDTGLVAMNAMTALVIGGKISRQMVLDFWNTPFPEGRYRYFDGCLYLFSLLNLSGNYRIIQ